MSQGDFDLESLTQYLHLSPQLVAKMADRGKLPGRRIGGQWRFSRADIHHWLEDRIGLSDEAELAHVESALDRAADLEDVEVISIAQLLPIDAIQIPLNARTQSSVVKDMTDVAARTGLLWDPAKMAEAVRARENLHPTALDNGVALLHPRRPLGGILSEPFLALGRTSQGIPFGGSRGVLTDVFFLICSTDDRTHLRVLARLSRLLADAAFLSDLRAAPDASAVLAVVSRYEQAAFGSI
jgi:PTS system nitrogen regulatory IIA component